MDYGRYQDCKEVGRGSMGVVYKARDPKIDRIVALKVLRQDRIATDTLVKRFFKEAKIIGRLAHPRIVTIYDIGEDNGTIYIAMEFLKGKPLSDLIGDKPFNAEKVIELGTQIAATLDYAHQEGVIHRDIKPSNIIINPDGQIKITDFGIAHIEDSSATLQTLPGEIMGTPAYMSPEQVEGHPVDCRSDIFSLGIILYELITGTRPFGGEGKGLATTFNEIMLTTPREPYKESQSIPEELSKIIMKALEKDPDKRFQTGRELADALQQCLKVKEKAVEDHKPPPRNAVRFGIPIAATLTVAIVAVSIYFLSQHKDSSPKKQQTRPAPESPAPPPAKLKAVTVKPAPGPVTPVTVKPATVIIPPPPAPQRTDVKKAETKPPDIPRKNGTKPIVPLSPPSTAKPLPKFAFLKVHSTPKGASVYINGTRKGITPLTIKLGLGEYQVRLSNPGYLDSNSKIKMVKMTEYAIKEKLKPIK